MTLPPNLYIKDNEFNKLHGRLSFLGFTLYFPFTLATGAIFGGMVGAVLGALFYYAGQVTTLEQFTSVISLMSLFGAAMFAQRYAMHGSQSVLGMACVQIIVLVVGAVFLLPANSGPPSTEVSNDPHLIYYHLRGLTVTVGFIIWIGAWMWATEFRPLVAVQKIILRGILYLPFTGKLA